MEQIQFNMTTQLKALWRYKWIIILVAVVAGVTALQFASMSPRVYQATTTLMVETGQQRLAALPAGLQGVLETTNTQGIGSQIQMMGSNDVLQQAITQLEPEKAANPDYMRSEILKLREALNIAQGESENLVKITVVSSNSTLAQKQANAVAEAYINKSQTDTVATIEGALENTTKRLGELQKSNVNLSISPVLARLTAQIDTALTALEGSSERLQQMSKETIGPAGGNVTLTQDAGTTLTMSQLSTLIQRINAINSEANQLAVLDRQLKLISDENDFTARSNSIAIIEARTLALVTKLEGLSAELGSIQQSEIDPTAREKLRAAEEQLAVASAAGQAILGQVVSLFGIQEQYMAASTVDLTTGLPSPSKDTSKEADAILLQRIVEHTNILTTSLNAALGQVQQIQPRAANLTQWSFEALGEKAASAAATLKGISQQLQPPTPGADVLLRHDELFDMEIRAQTVVINLASLSSELDNMRSSGLNPQVTAELLNVQELVSIANNIAGGLGDEIAGFAESGGNTTSYTTLSNLRQALQVALLSGNIGGVQIVSSSVSSPIVSFYTRYKGVLLAVIAGLLLSVLFVLVLQYFDRRVRDASQVKSQVGLPLLASIGMVQDGNPNAPSVLNEKIPQYLESFRLLRTNLGLDSYHGQVLLVSSPEGKEGKTTVSANLARVVALQGRKVLLIDGNLRNPGIAAAFGLAERDGLSGFLTREDEGKKYVTQVEGVHLLPAGGASMKSAELLSSPRMKALLEQARKTYDVVIVDSLSLIGYADTRILAKEVDGVLLVLQMEVSKVDLARDSKQMLETMGVRVVGIVLNKVYIKKRMSAPSSLP